MSVNPSTTPLAERIAVSRLQVRKLREAGRALGGRLDSFIRGLRERGRPIPTGWFDDYASWVDEVEALIAGWEGEPAFDACRPTSADGWDDLELWDAALERFQREHEAALAEQQRQIADRRLLLKRILDLTCSRGKSAGLHQAQKLAQQCQEELDSLGDTMEPVLQPDTGAPGDDAYSRLESLWRLIRLTADEDGPDHGISVELGESLSAAFGLELVMNVCAGRITPQSGWPAEKDATHQLNGSTATDGPGADVVAGEEAVARLKWAQSPEVETTTSRLPVTPQKPINSLELDSLRSRVRSAGDSARHLGQTENDPTHEQLADGFDALHSAICYTQSVLTDRPTSEASPQLVAWQAEFRAALQAMATSQSALRKFHVDRNWTHSSEQNDVYYWLNAATDHPDACYLHHMKLDQPADPARMVDLKLQTDAARLEWERPRRQKKLGKKIHYEIGQMTGDAATDRPHWETIIATVDHLLTEENVPPSNTSLREILLPRYDEFPDDLEVPASFQRVLHAIDEYQANRETEEAKRNKASNETTVSPHVAEVARLLHGRKLVMVGGVCNEVSRQRIEDALGLEAFEWLETREHESTEKFRPYLTSPDVFIVCLLVRWCGHHHIDSLKDYCRDADKHCVVMPRGYNLERVAHDILDQCGDRLRENGTS